MNPVNEGHAFDTDLLARVYGEYLEMPGLCLTPAQASRLWNLKLATTVDLMNHLVDASLLRRVDECYVRADSGRLCA